jgi:hypothetical protein
MSRFILTAVRILGLVLIAHALMLIGADEISSIEAGGTRTIRSFGHILTLYGADPMNWLPALPTSVQRAFASLLALPGWAVLASSGGLLALLTRARE